MVQVEAPTLAGGDARAEAERTAERRLIEQRYPERWGQVRRIHHLWNSFYRINYHLMEQANQVGESHFIRVEKDRIEELG